MKPLPLLPLGLFLLCAALHIPAASSVAVMSVDLGAEWMKVAVVSPGVPMEIALNPESKRKTAVAVALRDGERSFGSEALGVGVKSPKSCYFYLLDLLGKPLDHPQVKRFQQRFPYYDLKAHPETGTVLFQHDADTVYSVEELLAMVLEHAKRTGETFTEQKIKDAVITVPAYFNQAERRALARSADLAGINVLQLISEPAAVALNYGMFRRKEVNGTVKHLMFYDMGAQDTTASIVAYQVIKTKERGFSETHPQAQVIGVGYDRNLGGQEIRFLMRDYLADKFDELKKASKKVRDSPRAMGKLLKEAERVKSVLSANMHTYAQVENVMEDIDFKLQVSRETLQEMNADYFTRVTAPIDQALSAAAITIDEISEVILVGAGTRVPRVQELLQKRLNRELGKSLNTDESAAMGAVYKAADLSTGFKVKKFLTKEAVLFPIDVDFEREYETDDGEKGVKQVKRSLFSKMNPFPQKKIITFNKHVDDFTFSVNHNDLEHIGEEEIKNLGSQQLCSVSVSGVSAALAKHADEANVESKGIKAHFALDDSGLLSMTGVEAVFERTITAEEQEAEWKAQQEKENKDKDEKKDKNDKKDKEADKEEAEDDGAWGNLGDTISSFFGKDDDDKEALKKKGDKFKKGDKKKKDDKKKKEEEKKKEFKPKVETLKEPLEFTLTLTDLAEPSDKVLKEAADKLKALNDHDAEKKARETALNSLESFVIDTRDKLYQDVYETSVTEEEKEKIQGKCAEISDWIDEEVTPDTETGPLETKLKEIKDLTAAWMARVREHLDRPEALEALNKMLNTSQNFLAKAKNSTGDDGYFTQAEVDVLDKKITETAAWKEKAEAEQAEQPMHEMPKLTTSLIAEKGLEMDREVKYLLNKAKIAKAERDQAKKKKEEEEKKAKEEEEKQKKKEKKKKKKKSNATSEAAASEEAKPEQTEEPTVAEEEPLEEAVPATEEQQEEAPSSPEVDAKEEPEVGSDDDAELPTEEAGDEDSHTEL